MDQYFITLKNNELNVWTNLIHRFLVSCQDETSDAILPAGWLIDKFYEYISEQQRERVIGEGIFLGTFTLQKEWNFYMFLS